MKLIIGFLLIALSATLSWAQSVKLTKIEGDFVRGRPFDLTLGFTGKLEDATAVAIELRPLGHSYDYPLSYVRGEFLKGTRNDKLEYLFRGITIPDKAPIGWWRLDVMVIKDTAYQKLEGPFIYKTTRALKINDEFWPTI